MTVTVTDAGTQLDPDLSRIVLTLFLPGEDTHEDESRVGGIVRRIMALPEAEVEAEAERLVSAYTGEAEHLTRALINHADSVALTSEDLADMSPARRLLMGAAFTAEYAVEGAALCNPSAVRHPDQSGLEPGQLRVAVSLRGIGEGHISSIEFISAVIGPGAAWAFGERAMPLLPGETFAPLWIREHFMVAVEAEMRGHGVELAHAVARLLPEKFSVADFEQAIHDLPSVLTSHHLNSQYVERLHAVVESAYRSAFPAGSNLSQRILMPAARDEVNGMEDARFVLCAHPDGTQDYRATYTAYDGKHIAPRLIISPDLVTFDIHRMSGAAAKNKGIALFPRHVGGKLVALTRSDGETLGVSRSEHGRVWGKPTTLRRPWRTWQLIQTGNCGSPLETEHGWLVLTHGVGPMRRYCIGAILLDLEDPSKVIATLEDPLISPQEREGYVPNVVYSCGGIIHDGRLWIPYGVGDSRIRVGSVNVEELIAAMVPLAD